jgi:hypothetical protein
MALLMIITLGGPASAAEPTSFERVMEHYEPIRLALLEDSMEGVNGHGRAIADELRSLQGDFSPTRAGASADAAAVVREKLVDMIAAADTLAKAATLEAARDAFYDLTRPLVRWRQGVSTDGRPRVAYCSMYKRSWLQPGEEIGNPYGGMPRCGEIVAK